MRHRRQISGFHLIAYVLYVDNEYGGGLEVATFIGSPSTVYQAAPVALGKLIVKGLIGGLMSLSAKSIGSGVRMDGLAIFDSVFRESPIKLATIYFHLATS